MRQPHVVAGLLVWGGPRVRRGLRFPPLRFLIDVVSIEGMPRRLRIEYPGAIYHIMACGNGRQHIVCDDHDRQRLMDEFARCVNRTSWQVFSFVILSNRLHLVLKTPELNLARSVQRCLSSEAHYFFTHRKVRRSQDRRRHNGRAVNQ